MAQANLDLIDALRQWARHLEANNQQTTLQPDKETSRQLLDLGLSATDLQQLQTLSNPEVLEQLPAQNPSAPEYLRAWANLLRPAAGHARFAG